MREQLIERMIRIYGFEHPITIDFCRKAEEWEQTEWNDRCLATLVSAHEDYPQYED